MRLISGLLTGFSVVAFGFACGALALSYVAPEPQPFAAPVRAAAAAPAEDTSRDLPGTWPPVFGTVPPPPEPDPEPLPEPVAEAPPEENTTYYLTGLVAGRGGESWAMISENDRGLVVRVGDELIGGETVMAIDARGVWLDHKGQRQLIPVQRSDFGNLVWTETDDTVEALPADLLAEVTIPFETLDRRFIERALAEAGRLTAAELADGSVGMDIVWTQRGELFEQIGLRTGDTILKVNGKSVVTENLLADTPDADLAGGTISFEILRDGSRQVVKVNLDQG